MMTSLLTALWSSLFMFLLFSLVKFFYMVWWTPNRIQSMMRKQGIKGPAYKFFHGTSKEMAAMTKEAMSKPIDLSHNIFPRMQPLTYSWIRVYGKNFLNWHGAQAQFIVTEPEMIKEILNNKDGVFPKAEPAFYVKKLLGDGLVMTRGEKWTRLRKLANHAFHGESLKGMIPAMLDSTEMMLERWKHYEGKELEVYHEFRLLTSEIISRTAFGSSYREGENIFEMLTKLTIILSRNTFNIKIPGIRKFYKNADDMESEKLVKGIRDSVMEMIQNREKKVMNRELENYGNDFLGLLVKSNQDSDMSVRITMDDLIDECKTFYVAGQETTNTLLGWTVLMLAIHTDWQEEARKEVLKVFGQQIANYEGIARLKLMNMIINETLRLYPPVVRFQRNVKREVRVGNTVLPRNLNLLIPTLALHHDPVIWGEDVHLFKPERFSEGVAKATNNNIAAFLPFGLGPRNCVGMNFASFEAKIALSMILQRYRFTLSPNYVHSPCQLVTIAPQNGVQVILHAV